MGLCTAAATLLTSVIDRQAMSGSTAMMSNKKQREVYVGNLTIGVVNDVMLRDLFNGALSHLVADPHVNPPVVSTSSSCRASHRVDVLNLAVPRDERRRWMTCPCICTSRALFADLCTFADPHRICLSLHVFVELQDDNPGLPCSCERCSGLRIRSTTSCWTKVERTLAGRFGFVELRTEELAAAAMQLDKVELCGRSINVGRPKGYVEPPPGARPVAPLGAAQA
jgi:hypothetical protein